MYGVREGSRILKRWLTWLLAAPVACAPCRVVPGLRRLLRSVPPVYIVYGEVPGPGPGSSAFEMQDLALPAPLAAARHRCGDVRPRCKGQGGRWRWDGELPCPGSRYALSVGQPGFVDMNLLEEALAL